MPEVVELEGLEDALKAMRGLAPQLQGEFLEEALLDGADPIVERMAELAPVGPTGRLKESMAKEPGRRRSEKRAEVLIGFLRRAFYGRWVELGRSNPHQSADPFMRPAFDQRKAEAVEIVRERLRRNILRWVLGFRR